MLSVRPSVRQNNLRKKRMKQILGDKTVATHIGLAWHQPIDPKCYFGETTECISHVFHFLGIFLFLNQGSLTSMMSDFSECSFSMGMEWYCNSFNINMGL